MPLSARNVDRQLAASSASVGDDLVVHCVAAASIMEAREGKEEAAPAPAGAGAESKAEAARPIAPVFSPALLGVGETKQPGDRADLVPVNLFRFTNFRCGVLALAWHADPAVRGSPMFPLDPACDAVAAVRSHTVRSQLRKLGMSLQGQPAQVYSCSLVSMLGQRCGRCCARGCRWMAQWAAGCECNSPAGEHVSLFGLPAY